MHRANDSSKQCTEPMIAPNNAQSQSQLQTMHRANDSSKQCTEPITAPDNVHSEPYLLTMHTQQVKVSKDAHTASHR